MKQRSLLPLLALLLSAAALLGVLSGPPAATDGGAAVAGAGEQADPGLRVQLEELKAENRALSEQLDRLAAQPEPVEQRVTLPEGLITQEQFDAFREEVRRALASRELALGEASLGPGDPESAGFTAQVAETLEKIRRDEKIEDNQARLKGRRDRLAKRMPELAERLGLDANQQDLMRSALEQAYEVQSEIVLSLELGQAAKHEVGEAWQANLDELRASLGGFLSPQQFELYQGLSGDLFPGNGGRGK